VAKVNIKVDSVPSGARVIDVSDGTVVGTTPLSTSQARADGALAFRLELEGFKPRPISVPLSGDFTQVFELEAVPVPRPRSRHAAAARAVSPPAPVVPASPAPTRQAPKKAAEIEWE
jgi:hypothetical protein